MVDDRTKALLRRKLQDSHKDALVLGAQADDKLERLFIKRLSNLARVRRFVFLWCLLFVFLFMATVMQVRGLSNYYQTSQPVPGGLYNEGIIGTFTNANPLYATGAADTAVSRLVFSSLFKYDADNKLVGDLAENYKTGTAANRYLVTLKKGVKWQDGKDFTADDVIFTYKTIQNIEAESSLYSSWQGINVRKVSDYLVSFDLPNPLSSFPYSLTNGIVPEHLLKDIPPTELRSAQFNAEPVGTGPFVWKFVDIKGSDPENREQHITLAANKKYYAGRPKLDGFNLTTFSDQAHLVNAFKAKQISAMTGIDSLPSDLAKDSHITTYVIPLTSEVMAFFNNSHPGLNDVKVRQSLVEGVDRSHISSLSTYPIHPANSPLLKDDLGFDPTITELAYSQDGANQLLDSAGWTRDPSTGMRVKSGQKLQFNLVTLDNTDYSMTASFIQKQWRKLGIDTSVEYKPSDEMQSVISNHDYDILLYGINIGVDPDVYAYWDSSQASITSQGHLNLSEYKSTAADQALEFGRTRADIQLRAAKYKAFLTAWKNDAPALALYQPNYIYVSRGEVYNFERKSINAPADRFYNVQDWMIRQKRQAIRQV
jgi:peptide/nickel transport system substrate-binding protein